MNGRTCFLLLSLAVGVELSLHTLGCGESSDADDRRSDAGRPADSGDSEAGTDTDGRWDAGLDGAGEGGDAAWIGTCPGQVVSIPAGSFSMGASDLTNTTPHPVTLTAYAIDVTEVTVECYDECVEAGGCTTRPTGGTCNGPLKGSHPANCVDWHQAKAYCEWAGKQLPTEAQWEYAAGHGPSHWDYPWGQTAPTTEATWNTDDGTTPVDLHEAYGFGLRDMAGNVWEWVLDGYSDYSTEAQTDPCNDCVSDPASDRAVRGGGWEVDDVRALRTAVHLRAAPSAPGSPYCGFRCASTVP